MNTSRARTALTALLILGLALTLPAGSARFAELTPVPLAPAKVSRGLGIVRSAPTGGEQRRTGIVRTRLPHGTATAQRPPVFDPLAAGVFLAILRTHARSR